jgi:hypothetical protein
MKYLLYIFLSTFIISCEYDTSSYSIDASKIIDLEVIQSPIDTAKAKSYIVTALLASNYVNEEQKVTFNTELGSFYLTPVDSNSKESSISLLTAGLRASVLLRFEKNIQLDSINVSASIQSKMGSVYQVFKRIKSN